MSPAAAGPSRLKVMTIVGTRPEVVKMSRVLAELDAHTEHGSCTRARTPIPR